MLLQTHTGDVLVQSAAIARALEKEGVASLLAPPPVPPPVFFCTVEPSSAANQKSGYDKYTLLASIILSGLQVWSIHCSVSPEKIPV